MKHTKIAVLAAVVIFGFAISAYVQNIGNPKGLVLDASTGAPIPRAIVRFTSGSSTRDSSASRLGSSWTAEGGADGRFEIPVGRDTVGIVSIEAPGYVTLKRKWPSKQSTELDFQLTRPAILSGRLVDSANRPVAGVISLVVMHAQNPSAYTVKSAGDGAFQFVNLLAGKGIMIARAEGMAPVANDVEAVSGSSRDLAPIVLTRAAIVTGIVVDRGGRPAAGATMQIKYSSLVSNGDSLQSFIGGRITTSSSGRFRITGIVPGASISLLANGRITSSERMTSAFPSGETELGAIVLR